MTVDDGTGVINCVVRYPALAGKGVRSEERPPPKPVAEVGQLVRLAGRIRVKGQWREVLVDQICEWMAACSVFSGRRVMSSYAQRFVSLWTRNWITGER